MDKKIQITIVSCVFFIIGFSFCLFGFTNFSVRQGEMGCEEMCEIILPQTYTYEFYKTDDDGLAYGIKKITQNELASSGMTPDEYMESGGYSVYQFLEPVNCQLWCTSRPK